MINSGREWDWMDNRDNAYPNERYIDRWAKVYIDDISWEDAEIYNNIMKKLICTIIYTLTFKKVCLGWCTKKIK